MEEICISGNAKNLEIILVLSQVKDLHQLDVELVEIMYGWGSQQEDLPQVIGNVFIAENILVVGNLMEKVLDLQTVQHVLALVSNMCGNNCN